MNATPRSSAHRQDGPTESRVHAEHKGYHDDVLVPFVDPTSRAWCDAVIVPTSRGATAVGSGLALAASLADGHACPLVVMVSAEAATAEGRAHVGDVVRRESQGRVRPVIVDVSCIDPLVLGFAADVSQLATQTWADWPGVGDTPFKRNVGILLARREGWANVLFLDDDIIACRPGPFMDGIPLDAHNLGLAVSSLVRGWHRVVGWAATGSDDNGPGHADNSIVCRIRRRLGYPQGVFIGGGALAVRVDGHTPHFPRIYNEDWLHCISLLLRGGVTDLAIAGHVTQDRPQAALDETRAAMEEPGDILAEALMNLAKDPGEFVEVTDRKEFWTEVIVRRVELVRSLAPIPLEQARPDGSDHLLLARRALRGTQRVHQRMTDDLDAWAAHFQRYVRAWRGDATTWQDHLHSASQGRLPAPLERVVPRHIRPITGGRAEEALATTSRLGDTGTAEGMLSEIDRGGGWARATDMTDSSTSFAGPTEDSSRHSSGRRAARRSYR